MAKTWLVDTTGEPDNCDAIIETQMVFDLTPLRDVLEATADTSSPVDVEIGRKKLEYEY